jgi:hypothetical protein
MEITEYSNRYPDLALISVYLSLKGYYTNVGHAKTWARQSVQIHDRLGERH